MSFMYKYVDFIVTSILDNLKKIIFILSNTCYECSLLNDTFSILPGGKHSWFQYYFVIINYFTPPL